MDVKLRIGCALSGFLVAACGGGFRQPPTEPHPVQGAEPVVVDFPPPPAQIEVVTKDPGSPCVWIDGHWDWVGRRWQWFPGGWVTPPEGCHYAPPAMVWIPAKDRGVLYYTRPRWYPEDSAELDAQQVLSGCAEVRSCGGEERR